MGAQVESLKFEEYSVTCNDFESKIFSSNLYKCYFIRKVNFNFGLNLMNISFNTIMKVNMFLDMLLHQIIGHLMSILKVINCLIDSNLSKCLELFKEYINVIHL